MRVARASATCRFVSTLLCHEDAIGGAETLIAALVKTAWLGKKPATRWFLCNNFGGPLDVPLLTRFPNSRISQIHWFSTQHERRAKLN